MLGKILILSIIYCAVDGSHAQRSIGLAHALFNHPIFGAGAAGGDPYRPTQYRAFDVSSLESIASRRKLQEPLDQQPNCTHWVVTTASHVATRHLHALAGLPGWCKVVVLDRSSPSNFSLHGTGVVVLRPEDQEQLPLASLQLIPWDHFGRKNLGYLYAALHGAEVMYDTDEHNVIDFAASPTNASVACPMLPTSPAPGPNDTVHVAPVTGDAAFNPYSFWQPAEPDHLHPRGFPLALASLLTTRSGTTPAAADGAPPVPRATCVLQSLANGDPDLDAMRRLLKGAPVLFKRRGARLALPAGVFAPTNAQAALVSRAAFPGLMLPLTVNARVADVWRSYAAQRAMWVEGCGVAFADPWVTRYAGGRASLADLSQELDLYLKAEGLLQLLNELPLLGDEGTGGAAAGAGTTAEGAGAAGPAAHSAGATGADGMDALGAGTLGGSPLQPTSRLAANLIRIHVALYERGLLEVDDVRLLHAFLLDLGHVARVSPPGQTSAAALPALAALPAPSPPAPRQRAPRHRAAVCVTGLFRGGPFVVPSLERNVLSRLGMPYDIFVVSPELPRGSLMADAADVAYLLRPMGQRAAEGGNGTGGGGGSGSAGQRRLARAEGGGGGGGGERRWGGRTGGGVHGHGRMQRSERGALARAGQQRGRGGLQRPMGRSAEGAHAEHALHAEHAEQEQKEQRELEQRWEVVRPDYSNASALLGLPGWDRTEMGAEGVHNAAKWVGQITDLKACVAAIRAAAPATPYTHAVRARADTLFTEPLPMTPDEVPPASILVSDREAWGGVNDRFAAGALPDMLTYFALLDGLPEQLASLAAAPLPPTVENKVNAELMLRRYGESRGLAWHEARFTLCRVRAYVGGALVLDAADVANYAECAAAREALDAKTGSKHYRPLTAAAA